MADNKTALTFSQLKPLLMADLNANIPPFLYGEAGIGKTSFINNLAHDLHTEAFTLQINQIGTREDLTGARSIKDPKTDTYRQVFFPHADIQAAIDYANAHPDEHPLLYLDEINRTSADITSAALSLISERRIGTTILPENIRIIASGNDTGNVVVLDSASLTRMAVYHITPDVQSWLQAQDHLNRFIQDVLMAHPDMLVAKTISSNDADDDSDDSGDDDDNGNDIAIGQFDNDSFNQLTVPRTITYASHWLNSLGIVGQFDDAELTRLKSYISFAPVEGQDDMLYTGLQAHIGQTAFTDMLYTHIVDEAKKAVIAPSPQNAAAANTQMVLKPADSTLAGLTNAQDVDAVNAVISQLTDTDYENLVLWLLSAANVSKVNNNDAALTVIANFDVEMERRQLDKLDDKHVNMLLQLLNTASDTLSQPVLNQFLKNAGPISSGKIAALINAFR